MKKTIQSKSLLRLSSYSILFVIAMGVTAMLVLPSYVSHKDDDDAAPTLNLNAQVITSDLQAPIDVAFPGNGDVLVAEQIGKIRLVKNGKLTDAPLLDIGSKLIKLNMKYDVRGILGFTIHPQFNSNHKIYVFYCAPTTTPNMDHKNIVAEYTLLPNQTAADAGNSERIVFTSDAPAQGNNGGCIKFGPDGFLYIGIGDGGGGADNHGPIGNGQNMNTLLGKILRINVNGDLAHSIPKDNPFVNKPDVKPEIWAYGLRNPWRFTFDKSTKQLFCSDVGEGAIEEVDIIEKGGNYGWRIAEGTQCFNPKLNCDFTGTTKPIAEYDHHYGVCIIGGYVYNGKQLPAIKGKYLFGDWTGPLYYIQHTGNVWQRGNVVLQNYPATAKVNSFGEDPSGELYVITTPDTSPGNTKGTLYKIIK